MLPQEYHPLGSLQGLATEKPYIPQIQILHLQHFQSVHVRCSNQEKHIHPPQKQSRLDFWVVWVEQNSDHMHTEHKNRCISLR